MLDVLDVAAVRRWCSAAVDGLTAHQQEIDDLNVFPVPDGDTGTNLVLTLTAAGAALHADEPTDLPAALRSLARGAVLGARGNSGVIVSQLLRGLAAALTPDPSRPAAEPPGEGHPPAGRVLAGALERAVAMAYESVADPVEGTILSVARGAAEAARAADADDLAAV
ncbi:MAG: fatty acid kinase, partial [Mycobacteriales bacterium]